MAETYIALTPAFWPWVEARGGWRLPPTTVDFFASTTDGVRGVVAASAVAEGAKVLRIPFSMCIHGAPDGSAVGAAIAAQPVEVTPFVATVLAAHFEISGGAESEFAAYVGSLPTEVRVPMVGLGADAEALALFKGSAVGPVVCSGNEVATLEQTVRPLLAAIAADEGGGTAQLRAWAATGGGAEFRALYLRCYALVSSRSFDAAAQVGTSMQWPLLAPVLDQLNHSSNAAERNVKLAFAADSFELVATRPVAAGEQLLISYGELSDAELLAAFGFVESTEPTALLANRCNWVGLAEELVLGACDEAAAEEGSMEGAQVASRRRAIEAAGLLSDARVTKEELLPLPVFTAAQLYMLDDDEFSAWRELATSEGGGASSSSGAADSVDPRLLLGLEELEDPEVALQVLQTLLAVADAAIVAREESQAGDGGEGDGEEDGGEDSTYLAHAARFVLAQENALLHLMRRAVVMQIMQLGHSDSEGEEGEEDETEDEGEELAAPAPAPAASTAASGGGTAAAGFGFASRLDAPADDAGGEAQQPPKKKKKKVKSSMDVIFG